MPKVKTTYAYKIQSIVKEFPDEFMESINNQFYCNLCNCAVSCNKRFLVDFHRNTSKHQNALGSRSENLIPQTSQTFLRSSNTDFVEMVTKAFLSDDIPLYKLNNTHIKNLFRDIGHRLPSETTCRRTALHLSEDKLKRIRNAVHDKQIFVIVDESTLSGTQYLNILVGSLETPPHVSYLYDCQPLKYAPNSNIIAQAVDNAVRNLGINRSFCLLLSNVAKCMIAAGKLNVFSIETESQWNLSYRLLVKSVVRKILVRLILGIRSCKGILVSPMTVFRFFVKQT